MNLFERCKKLYRRSPFGKSCSAWRRPAASWNRNELYAVRVAKGERRGKQVRRS